MEDIITALKQLFDTKISDATSPLYVCKKVFRGDPYTIPEVDLPAIYIEPVEMSIDGNSQYDKVSNVLNIGIIYNAKDFFQSGEDDIVSLKKKLVQMIQKIETTGRYNDGCVLGIFRDNSCLFLNKGEATEKRVGALNVVGTVRFGRSDRTRSAFEAVTTVNVRMDYNR